MKRQLVCIVCPKGCRLTAEQTASGVTVTGNSCPRGAAFAAQELTDPHRSLTTTVKTTSAALPLLPVRTDGELPKPLLRQAMAALGQITATGPLHCGDTVCEDLLGTGVRVIATRDLPATKEELL